jgi:hypothetical protein
MAVRSAASVQELACFFVVVAAPFVLASYVLGSRPPAECLVVPAHPLVPFNYHTWLRMSASTYAATGYAIAFAGCLAKCNKDWGEQLLWHLRAISRVVSFVLFVVGSALLFTTVLPACRDSVAVYGVVSFAIDCFAFTLMGLELAQSLLR